MLDAFILYTLATAAVQVRNYIYTIYVLPILAYGFTSHNFKIILLLNRLYICSWLGLFPSILSYQAFSAI
jgi:hypothetical protein